MFASARPFWARVLTAALPTLAQTSAGANTTTTAAVELNYRSALEGYKRFADENVGSWRDSNQLNRTPYVCQSLTTERSQRP